MKDKWEVEYEGYIGRESFDSYEGALKDAERCIQAEYDAMRESGDNEWHESSDNIKIYKNGLLHNKVVFRKQDDNEYYDLVLIRVADE